MIAGLQEEIRSRDALNSALALGQTSDMELLLEPNRVMNRVTKKVTAAAAPLYPVQVMKGNPSYLRSGERDVIGVAESNGPPATPPEAGGNEVPSGS
eukprot:698661-Heterocapsa_arctica.AAC.1